jgi:tRNA threonylcarbamoyladenosine biosynthesis protein TsaB
VLILALDTTARAGSAAVVRDGAVVREEAGDAALTHGQRLPRDLMGLLERAGVRLGDIDLFAVAAGPGSFTGLRVGIATVQGLAMAGGRRVVPVPTLDALAWAGRNGRDPIAAWMDAQRGEVFAALYGADGTSLVVEPSSEPPGRTLERWTPHLTGRERFIGDGALRYRDAIAGANPGAGAATIVDPVPQLAGVIGAIASRWPDRGVLPHAVVPVYIRRSDAELARDRKWRS